MDIFNLEEATYEPCLPYEIILHRPLPNIYMLSYTLIDLQALISGFTKVCIDDKDYDDRINVYKEKHRILDYFQTNAIENLINSRLKLIDHEEKEKLAEDIIQIIESPEYGMVASIKPKIRPYPTTSRKFSKKYEDLLQIKEFKQGSFIASIASTVLAGIILKFAEKLIGENTEQPTINKNYFTININADSKISIESRSGNGLVPVDANEYINSIISKVDIDPNNVERSVRSLLDVMQNEKIIYKISNYNEKGVRTITIDVERFKGNFIDHRY